MNRKLNQGQRDAYVEKATAAIDRALDHRDDAFRAKVLDMTLKNQWDVDDPAFLIVLSTGEMRVLMETFPAQFEALMNRVFQRGEERWKLMTARLLSAVEASEQAAVAVGNDIEAVKQVLNVERTQLSAEVATVQGALGHERREMAKAMNRAAEEQAKVLQAESRVLLAELGKQARAEGKAQVVQLSKQLGRAHFWEVFAYACAAAIAWGTVAWFGGWKAHAHFQETDVWSDIERWNQPKLKACIQAQQTTCNFHIHVPE